jgi:hypothetical protein
MVTTHRMARLHHLFDHPRLLADDPSVCRAVARPASFLSPLAIYGAVARMGRDVARRGVGYAAVTGCITVSSGLDLGQGDCAVGLRAVGLFAIREEFQREATRRPARSSWRKSRSAPGHGWNPGASAASCVPGTPVRDAGMERGHRPRGVLGTDDIRSRYGSGEDPTGGCGVGEEVWGLLSLVSQCRASRFAASMGSAPAIIRFG